MTPASLRAVLVAVLVAMLAAFTLFGTQSNFIDALVRIWAEPWGKGTLLDLYVGFGLFAAWVWWRERSVAKAGAWFAAICLLGNLATIVYLLLALRGAKSVDAVLAGPRAA